MKEFKHLPGLDLIRVFGILVVVFYHYQVETAVRGLCPADFLPAMEPLVQVAVYTMTLLSGSCLCWQEKSRSWSMKRYLWGRFWHSKTPHLLNSISYCLTNGVLFTPGLSMGFIFLKG